MKHVKSLTKLPACASDYEPGPIPISVKLDFVTALLIALKPYFTAKYPATTS
jgi:hypothetical protein